MEQFLAIAPECVRLKSGHYSNTPLHLATMYNYCGIVNLLAEQVSVVAVSMKIP